MRKTYLRFSFILNFKKNMLHAIHRTIPLTTSITVWLGDVMTQIGLIFLAFSLIFLPFFVTKDNISAFSFSSDDEMTFGTIRQIEATSSRVNKKVVYAYSYIFKVGEQSFQGTSYGQKNSYLDTAKSVKIFYVKDNPALSHIEDMRNSEFPQWILLFLLIFPTIGIVMATIGVKKAKKAFILLKYGELAKGKLIASVATTTKINNRYVYKITFEFTTKKGKVQQMVAETHKVELLEDETLEGILYMAEQPEIALALDEISGCPRLQDDRQVLPMSAGKAFLYLICPMIIAFECLLVVLLW
jgi:hypothetical protein